MHKFDVVFHLGGEQNLPNLLAMHILPAVQHLILVTEKTAARSSYLKYFKSLGTITTIPLYNAFDFDDIIKVLNHKLLELKPYHFGFNITGGTKIMSLAALRLATELNAPYFYLNTAAKQVLCWNYTHTTIPFSQAYLTINDFFAASGHELAASRSPLATASITDFVYSHRASYSRLQKRLCKTPAFRILHNSHSPSSILQNQLAKIFPVYTASPKTDYLDLSPAGTLTLCLSGESHTLTIHDKYQRLLHWLAGGWFEEYLFYQLKHSLDSGALKDLALGLTVNWRETTPPGSIELKQEIDLAFTDGITLWLVEAKTGRIFQDGFNKLEQSCKIFAGVLGSGILISLWKKGPKQDPGILERVRGSFHVAMLNGDPDRHLNIHTLKQLTPQTILE